MRDKKGAVRWDRDSREDNQETERERKIAKRRSERKREMGKI